MSSVKNLEKLHLLMDLDTTFQIKLNGHVCCIPGLELSLKRAERVKSYLVSKGIDPKRVTCKGFSNDVKLYPEITEENKRRNMRVEVIFVK
jgi:outer membrane protein OmpA-like peptidoglycan-associated protein